MKINLILRYVCKENHATFLQWYESCVIFRYIFLISKLIFKKISELMLIYLEDAYAA